MIQIWNSACLRILLAHQKLELATVGKCKESLKVALEQKNHSRDIHATVARYSRDSSVTFLLQHGDISACLVNELDMKEIVIISEKMAGSWNLRDQVLVNPPSSVELIKSFLRNKYE